MAADPLAALDTSPLPLVPAAVLRLAGRLLATAASPADDQPLTVTETCELLKVSRRWCYRHATALGAVRLEVGGEGALSCGRVRYHVVRFGAGARRSLMQFLRFGLPIALLLLVTACGTMGWKRVELTPQSLGDHVAWVWTHGQRLEWRSVVITADSVTGTQWTRCLLHCQRALPRADVDSIVLSHPVGTVADYAGLAALIGVGLYLLTRPEFH